MSTHIIYDLKIVRFEGKDATGSQDLYGIFILSGSSNCYTGWGKYAKRSRDWGMIYCGELADLVAYAIDWSRHFRGLNTVWKNMGSSGHLTAQQWISKIRRAAKDAFIIDRSRLDKPSLFTDGMCLQGKGEYEGSSLALVLDTIRNFSTYHPGQTMWQFLSVSAPKD